MKPMNLEAAFQVSRRDENELLGTFSPHVLFLEEYHWPTAEHYFQAMQFAETEKQQVIGAAASPEIAVELGEPGLIKSLFRKRRENWDSIKHVYMTRAIYTKCKSYDEVASALLATGDEYILENSQYDYFWGCGRDLRGENRYGQILMEIREKLREDAP